MARGFGVDEFHLGFALDYALVVGATDDVDLAPALEALEHYPAFDREVDLEDV